MSQNRGKQNHIAKRKKKRAQAASQSRAGGPAMPSSPEALIREGAKLPMGPAFVSATYRAEHEVGEIPKLVAVVVTRRAPGGFFLPAFALVDRTCLGVKDGFVGRPLTRPELAAFLEQAGLPLGGFEEHDVATAQSIVLHALDYARSLGFAPHPDFPEALFLPRPTALVETRLARPPRPIYARGPDDDPSAVVEKLRQAVGDGNFDVVLDATR